MSKRGEKYRSIQKSTQRKQKKKQRTKRGMEQQMQNKRAMGRKEKVSGIRIRTANCTSKTKSERGIRVESEDMRSRKWRRAWDHKKRRVGLKTEITQQVPEQTSRLEVKKEGRCKKIRAEEGNDVQDWGKRKGMGRIWLCTKRQPTRTC